jgi:hypothetical protein
MKNLILVIIVVFQFSCKNLKEIGKTTLEKVSEKEEQSNSEFYNVYIEQQTLFNQEILNSWNANPPAFMIKNTNGWRELGPNSTDNTVTWSATNATNFFPGQLTFVAFSPVFASQLVLTGSEYSGLWYSEDKGENWKYGGTDQLGPIIGVSHAVVDPTNESTWYIATGNSIDEWGTTNGIYKTIDKGLHWTPLFINSDFAGGGTFQIKKMMIKPDNSEHMYVCTKKGLFLISDLHSTPQLQLVNTPGSNQSYYDIEFKIDNPNIIYASGSGDANNPAPLVWSIDGGLSWGNMPVTVSNLTNSSVTLGAYRIAMEVPMYDATNSDYVNKMYAIVIKDPDLETGTIITPDAQLGNIDLNFHDPNSGCDDRLTAKLYRFNFNQSNVNNSQWIDKGWLFRGTFYINTSTNDPCGNFAENFDPLGCYESGGIDISRAQSFGISPTDANILFFGDVRMAQCTTGLNDNFGAYASINGTGQNDGNIHDDIHSIKPFPDGSGIIQVGDGGASTTTSITSGTGFARKNKGLNIADVLRFSISQTKKDIYALGLMHDYSAVARDNKWYALGYGDGQTPMVNYDDANRVYVSWQGRCV